MHGKNDESVKWVKDQCQTTCTNPDNYNGGSERGAEGKKRVVGSYRKIGITSRVNATVSNIRRSLN